jgi:hypothetical protein
LNEVCENWAKYQKNISIHWFDRVAEENSSNSNFVGENCETLFCRLDERVIFCFGKSMLIFYGDPLKKRGIEFNYRVI